MSGTTREFKKDKDIDIGLDINFNHNDISVSDSIIFNTAGINKDDEYGMKL